MSPSNNRLVGNLPALLSSFIGRTREIDDVKASLSVNRLVTLSGTGGCGKTRLAYKIADEMSGEFENGAWVVELAPLSDQSLVLQTIAAVFNIHEKSGRKLISLLIEHLKVRRTLLLADNCEHLIVPCAAILEELLQACPDLKVLTTSRETLGISGEIVWNVPPLSIPDIQPWKNSASAREALQAYQKSESVRLFIARAASAVPNFTMTIENGVWIAEICRRLDGLPLAIELAAARVRSLSVMQIAERIDDRFHFLTAGSRTGPPRQQTLAATLDWSYSLLSSVEQKVLQKLSVFAGGATIKAAEAACAGSGVESSEVFDVLARLVNKSLVTAGRSEHGDTRYGLLETIRQYARERLNESGEEVLTRDRHLSYFVELSETAEPHLEARDQLEWLDRLEIEHDNLRTALEWSRIKEGRVNSGLRLAASLGEFWESRSYYSEGRTQLTAVLAKTGASDRTLARAKALYHTGNLAFSQTDYPEARTPLEESLTIFRELGPEGRLGVAYSLIMLGDMWRELGSYKTAQSLLEEALGFVREVNDLKGLVRALWQLGYCALSSGDNGSAEQYFIEVMPLSRQNGDHLTTAVILTGLAEIALRQDDFDRAQALEEESLQLRREIGETWGIAVSLGNFAWISLRKGDLRKAATLLLESMSIRREIEDKGGIAWCLEKLAEINSLNSHFLTSVTIFGAASALRAPVGSVMDASDQPDYERLISRLQNALGKEAFTAAWTKGQALSLDQAVDYVVGNLELAEDQVSLKEKFGGLTEREREVAALIARGKSNREIATTMTVGVKTIETYVTRILNKLGFASRVQIATWWIENGLDKKESK